VDNLIKTVGVIGAGTMGTGIVQVLAQNGYNAIICDRDLETATKSIKNIEKVFDRLISKERMTVNEKEEALSKISKVSSLEDLKDCDMVIEAATENMSVKKQIMKEISVVCSENTILATNTSSLSITELAQAVDYPENVIGIHFFNPVPLMQLVELIKGLATSKEVFKKSLEFVKSINKKPVEVEEAPGFVVNRILIPMINEAVGVLADGVASKEDIDLSMKLGANHPLGPLALADLIGLDVCLAIMEVLHCEFGEDKYRPHPLLRKMVRGNYLGRKTKRGFYEY
jgi:3-hydroxybutyryl-CoA dehydrogenase